MEQHQKIFKLASVLLQYPEPEWLLADDLRQEIIDLDNRTIREIYLQFVDYMEIHGVERLAEQYVGTFDFSDTTTLYLTYHRFGDNPDRGPAFIKLREEFASAGYPLEDDELPDYLPLVLEFASIASPEHARKIFMIHKQTIDRLLAELDKADSPYRWIIQALVHAIDAFLAESKAS
ncbi:MAG TPA: nitrate reductase molybdenum cofactor assembly chaperone [Paenibacillus sp.]|uniref:nitrate reductase molybdenum cofactor assembly chaperone n=1 Tax=Paenibacillus sp. TaxID=58172 RepID=UPI0028D78F48|nr:nitrate reductase molybdenum cofactor assembly chaperone [Paenibacillus sp.]HUC91752.1 nitrate reductase molybdenum cofactor assembly chaperone [Paenibacillus sp.]